MGRRNPATAASHVSAAEGLARFVPAELLPTKNIQRDIPRFAKDPGVVERIERAVQSVPTRHELRLGDARERFPQLDQLRFDGGGSFAADGDERAMARRDRPDHAAGSGETTCGPWARWWQKTAR